MTEHQKLIKVEAGWYKTVDGRYTLTYHLGRPRIRRWQLYDSALKQWVGTAPTLSELKTVLERMP